MTGFWQTTSSSTADPPPANTALLRARFEEGLWVVDDLVGLQYGAGDSLEEALREWCKAVDEFLAFVDANRCAAPLLREAAGYRRALGTGTTFSAPAARAETTTAAQRRGRA